MLALAALNRRRRMQRRRNRRFRFWCLPRPRQSWFEIHYNDHRIPDGFFKQQLRVRRATFYQLLNNVSPHVARQDTSMRNCIPAEKTLAKNCENSIFAGISDLTDIAAEEKQKIVILWPLDKI